MDGQSFSDGATWVDGLVGIRGNYSFTPQFYFTGWALVGAGGADIDWDVAGGSVTGSASDFRPRSDTGPWALEWPPFHRTGGGWV